MALHVTVIENSQASSPPADLADRTKFATQWITLHRNVESVLEHLLRFYGIALDCKQRDPSVGIGTYSTLLYDCFDQMSNPFFFVFGNQNYISYFTDKNRPHTQSNARNNLEALRDTYCSILALDMTSLTTEILLPPELRMEPPKNLKFIDWFKVIFDALLAAFKICLEDSKSKMRRPSCSSSTSESNATERFPSSGQAATINTGRFRPFRPSPGEFDADESTTCNSTSAVNTPPIVSDEELPSDPDVANISRFHDRPHDRRQESGSITPSRHQSSSSRSSWKTGTSQTSHYSHALSRAKAEQHAFEDAVGSIEQQFSQLKAIENEYKAKKEALWHQLDDAKVNFGAVHDSWDATDNAFLERNQQREQIKQRCVKLSQYRAELLKSLSPALSKAKARIQDLEADNFDLRQQLFTKRMDTMERNEKEYALTKEIAELEEQAEAWRTQCDRLQRQKHREIEKVKNQVREEVWAQVSQALTSGRVLQFLQQTSSPISEVRSRRPPDWRVDWCSRIGPAGRDGYYA